MNSKIKPIPQGTMFEVDGSTYEVLDDHGSGIISAHQLDNHALVKVEFDADEEIYILKKQRVTFYVPCTHKEDVSVFLLSKGYNLLVDGEHPNGYFYATYEKPSLPTTLKEETATLLGNNFEWRISVVSMELGTEADEEWEAKLDFDHPWREWSEDNKIPKETVNYKELEHF